MMPSLDPHALLSILIHVYLLGDALCDAGWMRAPERRRPHVMVQPLEAVRGVMAFLVGHGVEGAALTQVVTSAKGLLSISRPVLATRMRMLKDHLAGNALVRHDQLAQSIYVVLATAASETHVVHSLLSPGRLSHDNSSAGCTMIVLGRE